MPWNEVNAPGSQHRTDPRELSPSYASYVIPRLLASSLSLPLSFPLLFFLDLPRKTPVRWGINGRRSSLLKATLCARRTTLSRHIFFLIECFFFFIYIDCPLDVVIAAIVPSVTRKIYGRDAPLGYHVASNLTRCSLRANVRINTVMYIGKTRSREDRNNDVRNERFRHARLRRP